MSKALLSEQTASEKNPDCPPGEEKATSQQVTDEVALPVPEEPLSSEAKQNQDNLHTRKRAVSQKSRKRVRTLLIILLFLVAVAAGIWYYVSVEINTLEVSFYHLQSDNVNSSFRIVQLSDLHLHEFGEKNAVLVDWVRRLNPDIIAITGDMNNHFDDDTHVVTELCSQLTKITDVYYVMGNHEWVDHIDRKTSIKQDILATGVTILENSYLETQLNGNKVVIGGLVNEVSNYEKYNGPKFMENFMKTDGFKLLLVHYPEYFLGTLNHYTIDLVMCGHTHGGIIRLPKLGGLYASDQGFSRNYAKENKLLTAAALWS